MSTFVSVGNAVQPFDRLLDAVAALARDGHLSMPVSVQYGSAKFSCDACRSVAFLDMEQFAAHIRDATVVILHGGAGSIIHACQAGKVPIVMPRLSKFGEHVDDHQLEFVCELDRLGKVVMVGDQQELTVAVAQVQAAETSSAEEKVKKPPLIDLLIKDLRDIETSNFIA